MINYFIPFIALAICATYIKLNKRKIKKRFKAPLSHQLPTQKLEEIKVIIETIKANSSNQELADQ